MARRGLVERFLYFALVPAIVVAVLVLGGVALRTTLQIEKAQQETVFEATLTLADERVDRLDKLIIAQDNVIAAHVDVASLSTLERRWLSTAGRETPTVRAIVVVDMVPDHEVLAFASRRPGAEDDAFRRMLLTRLIPRMSFEGETEELRHLHHAIDRQSYMLSYWQRVRGGRRVLIVAWHEVPKIVREVFPRLYRETDKAPSRMNVVDEEGKIVFGPPIQGGAFTVGRPFPTTLYNWRLQVVLTTTEDLGRRVRRQRLVELGMVGFSAVVAIVGVTIIVLASAKERRLAALKSDFVANVSHELKTPLSLIRLFGELLLLGRVSSDDKRRQYLSIIVGESERLTALIENVLDFARVERGRAAYEFVRVDVAEVVSRAVEVYRYRAEREGMNVVFRADDGPAPVMADARALELAVINLLDNAVKYAKDGGRVEVVVALEPGGRAVTVRVADDGPGIDEDDRKRIFERFVRGRNAAERQIRGSGIGLALVKHIAESHGGSVHVETAREGRGSAFVVRLPALLDGPAASETAVPQR